ncbi:ABC transporter permease subunit [Paenibacillus sp. FJAT-26967]|uniref:ABC transporter permease subunit n=1 Tax=Paenibacillus sp. FJAT-26967 TaxID=1729690 RepID=UPI000838CB6C|nr:ABC transporter permease subunit [Paenibacillus sp. FJAT-26967]
MYIIAAMTWKEMLRKRVLLLTLLMTVVFLLGFWFIADTISMDLNVNETSGEKIIERFERGVFILILGFFFGSFVLAFLAIFSSFSVISGEAELGVMQALMPRPVPRWKWYTGRWLGYVSLGILYAFILFAAILLITDYHATVPRQAVVLLQSFLLFSSVVPLLISISMLGSGIFSAIGNGVLMTMLYGGGWLGGMIEKVGDIMHLAVPVKKTLSNLSVMLSLVMPADAIQKKMVYVLFSYNEFKDNFIGNGSIFSLFIGGQVPSTAFIVYAQILTLTAFIVGMLRFNKRDL